MFRHLDLFLSSGESLRSRLSELDPLGRAVFVSSTTLVLPDLTQTGASKSLLFEEQGVQPSEISRGDFGRNGSRSFEESGSRST